MNILKRLQEYFFSSPPITSPTPPAEPDILGLDKEYVMLPDVPRVKKLTPDEYKKIYRYHLAQILFAPASVTQRRLTEFKSSAELRLYEKSLVKPKQ